MTDNNIKNLKERFWFYKKQKKFKLSFLDWTPLSDWYFLLIYLFVLIIFANWFAYSRYHYILSKIESEPKNITKEETIVNYEEVSDLIDIYINKSEVLNNLR